MKEPSFPDIPVGITDGRVRRLVGRELIVVEQVEGLRVAVRADGLWGRGPTSVRSSPLPQLVELWKRLRPASDALTIFGYWCGAPTTLYSRLPRNPFFVETVEDSEKQIHMSWQDRGNWAARNEVQLLPTLASFQADSEATIHASIRANNCAGTSRLGFVARTGIIVLPAAETRFLSAVSLRIPLNRSRNGEREDTP